LALLFSVCLWTVSFFNCPDYNLRELGHVSGYQVLAFLPSGPGFNPKAAYLVFLVNKCYQDMLHPSLPVRYVTGLISQHIITALTCSWVFASDLALSRRWINKANFVNS
jgi:hypothetical protein